MSYLIERQSRAESQLETSRNHNSQLLICPSRKNLRNVFSWTSWDEELSSLANIFKNPNSMNDIRATQMKPLNKWRNFTEMVPGIFFILLFHPLISVTTVLNFSHVVHQLLPTNYGETVLQTSLQLDSPSNYLNIVSFPWPFSKLSRAQSYDL